MNNKQQFIYVLKLIPRLLNENNWTEKENHIIELHFQYLQSLLNEEKLILAGRTLTMDERSFGIVILQVHSEEEAHILMNNDPALKEGIMTSELFPYKVALINNVY